MHKPSTDTAVEKDESGISDGSQLEFLVSDYLLTVIKNSIYDHFEYQLVVFGFIFPL